MTAICRTFIDQRVLVAQGSSLGHLMTITEAQAAAEAVWNAIVRQEGNRRERLRPMINRLPTQAKATTARASWCASVNNHGGFGRWGYVEMTDPLGFKARPVEAIQLLYDDAPIIGDPGLLDFDDLRSARGA